MIFIFNFPHEKCCSFYHFKPNLSQEGFVNKPYFFKELEGTWGNRLINFLQAPTFCLQTGIKNVKAFVFTHLLVVHFRTFEYLLSLLIMCTQSWTWFVSCGSCRHISCTLLASTSTVYLYPLLLFCLLRHLCIKCPDTFIHLSSLFFTFRNHNLLFKFHSIYRPLCL